MELLTTQNGTPMEWHLENIIKVLSTAAVWTMDI
jgi:hypothetical protein